MLGLRVAERCAARAASPSSTLNVLEVQVAGPRPSEALRESQCIVKGELLK